MHKQYLSARKLAGLAAVAMGAWLWRADAEPHGESPLASRAARHLDENARATQGEAIAHVSTTMQQPRPRDRFGAFKRLVESGQPAQLWQAHQQAMACRLTAAGDAPAPVDLRGYEETVPSPSAIILVSTGKRLISDGHPAWFPAEMLSDECQGIPDVGNRTLDAWLETAANAAVPGAVTLYALSGPFGDPSALRTRPDDLLVIEWRTHVVDLLLQAIRQGDLATATDANFWLNGSGAFSHDREGFYRAAMDIGLAAQGALAALDARDREDWATVVMTLPTVQVWPEHPDAVCVHKYEFGVQPGWTTAVAPATFIFAQRTVIDTSNEALQHWCPLLPT